MHARVCTQIVCMCACACAYVCALVCACVPCTGSCGTALCYQGISLIERDSQPSPRGGEQEEEGDCQ